MTKRNISNNSAWRMLARTASSGPPKLLRALYDIGSFLSRHPGWTTFAVTILLLWPILPFGLDVTDSGLHLTNQDMALSLGLLGAVVSPFWWLSDVLGGIWMRHTDSFGLLGMRWGWALTIAAAAGIGTAVVRQSFGGGLSLVPGGILAGCYSATVPVMVPDYYIVPGLLGTLVCAAYFRGGIASRSGVRAGWGLAAGTLFGIAIGARLPMLLLVTLPVAHCGYLVWRRADRTAWLLPLTTGGAALVTVVFGLLLLRLSGKEPLVIDALSGLDTISGDGATVGGFFVAQTLGQLRTHTVPLLCVVIPLAGLVLAIRRGWPAVAIAMAVAFAAVVYGVFPALAAGAGRFNCLVLLAFAAWLLFAGAELSSTTRDGSRPVGEEGRVIVALAGPIFALVICGGSSLGLLKLSYGAAILFPLIIGWGARLARGLRPVWARRTLGVAILMPVALGGELVWASLFSSTTGFVYGDARRVALTAQFGDGRLAGIFTQPGRRDSFQDLMDAVRRYSKPGDEIFAFSHVGMIYYATGRRPPLGLATPDLLPHARLGDAVRQLCVEPGRYPVLIVRTRTAMGHPSWGTPQARQTGAPVPGPFWETNRRIMDQAVDDLCKPELLWSNRDFEVLRPHSRE